MDYQTRVLDVLRLAKKTLTYGELSAISGISRGLSRTLIELQQANRVDFKLVGGQVTNEMPIVLIGSQTVIRIEMIINGNRHIRETDGTESFSDILEIAEHKGKNPVDILIGLAGIGKDFLTHPDHAATYRAHLGL